ncbi:MAG TPA: PepSY-associated TM helix domain-containing protein [Hyphomicrobiales bacterium]|nr:PepSY-associated TM helix domain-containing protein [Hyphomicrobiales bacterium]
MNLLSQKLVKSSLTSHSWLGLALGGLMYLICLSGTLTIFYEEIERWEQPVAEESLAIDPMVAEASFNRYMSSSETTLTEHMYLVFPNATLPRMKVASDTQGRYVNRDGSLGEVAHDEVSELWTGLHVTLHLPDTLGFVLVSATGALLCALIISGFLAHPSIVKDAFKFRSGGAGRLGQMDLHNRLGVWGAPFHVMIAVTGAYYGLVALMIGLFASSIDGADPLFVTEAVFPAEPALVNQAPVYGVARALEKVWELSPDGKLLYLIVHDADSDNRFMEFYVQQPGLLAWSENYRFDTSGNYLGTAGYTEGEAALQALYSVYRIHFGHFGGFITKLFYVVLGLSLTVVSASGVNIWLEKRKYRDGLNLIWPGIVWGMPLAMGVASFTQAIFHIPSTAIFWGMMIVAMTGGLFVRNEYVYKRQLQVLTGITLVLLVLAYLFRFGADALTPAGWPVNLVLLCLAGLFFFMAYRAHRTDAYAMAGTAA